MGKHLHAQPTHLNNTLDVLVGIFSVVTVQVGSEEWNVRTATILGGNETPVLTLQML